MHYGTVKRALPIVQIVISALLMANNAFRPGTIQDPAWTKPDIQLCHMLNTPTAIVMFAVALLEDQWMPTPSLAKFFFEKALYLTLVWLLWYAVAIEITGRGESVLTPKTRLRAAIDVLLMILGAGLVACSVLLALGPTESPWVLRAVGYLIWGAALITFYAHDLGVVRRRAVTPERR